MRFLIIDTYYPNFFAHLYRKHPGLENQPYEVQKSAIMASALGTADFFSVNLQKLGHEAQEVIFNCEPLQRQWVRENGLRASLPQLKIRRVKGVPIPLIQQRDWFQRVLIEQIRFYRPDILYTQGARIPIAVLKQARPLVRLITGQHGADLPEGRDLSIYDLILSCHPRLVSDFRKMGVASEYFRLGFDPSVLTKLTPSRKTIPVSFVGSLSPQHTRRQAWLEGVCRHHPVEIWGRIDQSIPENSVIRRRYRGSVEGLSMYQLLSDSQVTLNHHVDMAAPYAANMRLYEATGVGTLLITEEAVNLGELFEPGKEVVTYSTPDDCIEKIKYYLGHEQERATIARAGQQRTLRDHTYFQRMQELVTILQKYL